MQFRTKYVTRANHIYLSYHMKLSRPINNNSEIMKYKLHLTTSAHTCNCVDVFSPH